MINIIFSFLVVQNKGDFCLIGWEETRSHAPKCHAPTPNNGKNGRHDLNVRESQTSLFGVFARQMLLFEIEEYFVTFIWIWLTIYRQVEMGSRVLVNTFSQDSGLEGEGTIEQKLICEGELLPLFFKMLAVINR